MSVKTYRKNPVTITALQWTGHNIDEMYGWAHRPAALHNGIVECFMTLDDDTARDTLGSKLDLLLSNGCTAVLWCDANDEWLGLVDSEWVAQDSEGFYPIKNAVFKRSYTEDTVPDGAIWVPSPEDMPVLSGMLADATTVGPQYIATENRVYRLIDTGETAEQFLERHKCDVHYESTTITEPGTA